MTIHQMLLLITALTLGAESKTQDYNTHIVKCNHETPVCECDHVNSKGEVDVCEFSLDIQQLATFTRYEVDRNGDLRGGGVWNIDRDTGELKASSQSSPCNVDLEDTSCTQPNTVDGSTFRSFIGVNGQIPGPTLIVNYDQTVVVHVTNHLASESTSIHWHGMHQRKSNVMDGVEHITQCGISPGATFTYIFKASPYGTTWYHSHSGAQRTDGLFGSLVVKENKETLENITEILGDFIDDPASHTLSFLDWRRESFIGIFRFWSGLINGKGRHRSLDNYKQTRLSIFSVLPNTTYRFRLVGAQSLYGSHVSIDDHKLTVIATDGAFIEPVTVDYIFIESGERYDLLLTTKTTQELGGKTNFIIRGETSDRMHNTTEAILHYDADGSPNADYLSIIENGLSSLTRSCTATDRCKELNCNSENYPEDDYIDCLHIHKLKRLLPRESDLPNGKTNTTLFFNFGFEGVSRTGAINGRNLQLPSTPLVIREPNNLCTALDTDDTCDAHFNTSDNNKCVCTHVRKISSDQSVQLVLSSLTPDPDSIFLTSHPVHLHGHYFHVVDVQFGEYDDNGVLVRANEDIECGGTQVCTNPRWRSPEDPKHDYAVGQNGKISASAPLKDTLIIPAGGYAVVYFQSDNPGYWFLHCHSEYHQTQGMGVVIYVGNTGNQNLPPGYQKECGDFDWTVDDFNDLVNHGTALNSSYLLILILFSTVGIVVGT